MRKIFMFVLAMCLSACGNVNGQQPTCTVSWACGDQACANYNGAWSGTGSFTGSNDESDCLAWSFAFINANQGTNRAGSCTCN
jgi:hypothetical protein